jgi:hypothetical protein
VGICLFGDPLIHVDLNFSPKHAPGASPPERGDPRSALDVLSSLPARRVTVTFTAFSVRAGRRGVAGPGQTTVAFMCRSRKDELPSSRRFLSRERARRHDPSETPILRSKTRSDAQWLVRMFMSSMMRTSRMRF